MQLLNEFYQNNVFQYREPVELASILGGQIATRQVCADASLLNIHLIITVGNQDALVV